MSPKKPIPGNVPGADVQPTGMGGSYLIDPATGRPLPAASPFIPPLPTPPQPASPPQVTPIAAPPIADKESGK